MRSKRVVKTTNRGGGERRQFETAFHKTVANYLNMALPADAWWTTIPAGGGGYKRGAKLKAMGYKAGTPDILIIYLGIAFWIELKSQAGKASDTQLTQMHLLRTAGCYYPVVAQTIEDVELALAEWKIPTRFKMKRAA